MKKFLLLSSAALLAFAASAEIPAPRVLENELVSGISPDGTFIASEDNGSVTITNLLTNETWTYDSDGLRKYYSIGNGNAWSANGMLVGTTATAGDAAFWKDGEWHQLPNPDKREVWMTAVNAEGTMAVASVSSVNGDNDPLSYLPGLWTLGEDGEWTGPIILPHPDKDFTGRVPQVANAQRISRDGSVIAGQLRDYSGAFCYPLVYRKDAAGNWQYELLAQDLINPKGRQFPEWIENDPVMPEPEDYMNDDDFADYDDARNLWAASQYSQDLYPDPMDYISDEFMEKYQADLAKYYEDAQAYNKMFNSFFAVWNLVLDEMPGFVYNSIIMDAEGKHLATTMQSTVYPESQFEEPYSVYTPFYVDLSTGTGAKLEGPVQLNVTEVTPDGTMLAYSEEIVRHAYIKRPDAEWMRFEDYMKPVVAAETYSWLEENTFHDYELTGVGAEGDGILKGEHDCVLGIMHCTPDLSVFTGAVENVWDLGDSGEGGGGIAFRPAGKNAVRTLAPEKKIATRAEVGETIWYYSYVIPTPELNAGAGIKGIEGLDAEGEAEYFNLQGVRIAAPAAGEPYILRRGATSSKRIAR